MTVIRTIGWTQSKTDKVLFSTLLARVGYGSLVTSVMSVGCVFNLICYSSCQLAIVLTPDKLNVFYNHLYCSFAFEEVEKGNYSYQYSIIFVHHYKLLIFCPTF